MRFVLVVEYGALARKNGNSKTSQDRGITPSFPHYMTTFVLAYIESGFLASTAQDGDFANEGNFIIWSSCFTFW